MHSETRADNGLSWMDGVQVQVHSCAVYIGWDVDLSVQVDLLVFMLG